MIYDNNFVSFVEDCNKLGQFVGLGNPNSNILLVGKESAIDSNDRIAMEWYLSNSKFWKNLIYLDKNDTYEYPVKNDHPLRKNWGKNTWSKYQRLNDFIFHTNTPPYYVNFLKNIFTTEINDSPSLKTGNANKSSISGRKLFFKESEFIQEFKVVVLACSDYFKNNDKIREIDETFGVKYIGDKLGKYYYSSGNWFFIHKNHQNTKMVIHTRQLSTNVNNDLLKDLGAIINDFLNYSQN